MSLVFRESAVAVDVKGSVHHGLDRLGSHHKVHHRSERPRHLAHKIRACKKTVTESRSAGTETAAGRVNQVGDLNAGRAGHLAAFAVHTILQVLVEKVLVLQTKPLPVRTGLLRPWIQRIDSHHRTVSGTNRTFDALLEIIETYIFLLHIFFNVK